jgi:hypothetical protein
MSFMRALLVRSLGSVKSVSKTKGLRLRRNPLQFLAPDLGSNQGPTD